MRMHGRMPYVANLIHSPGAENAAATAAAAQLPQLPPTSTCTHTTQHNRTQHTAVYKQNAAE